MTFLGTPTVTKHDDSLGETKVYTLATIPPIPPYVPPIVGPKEDVDPLLKQAFQLSFNERNERLLETWVLKQTQGTLILPIFMWSLTNNLKTDNTSEVSGPLFCAVELTTYLAVPKRNGPSLVLLRASVSLSLRSTIGGSPPAHVSTKPTIQVPHRPIIDLGNLRRLNCRDEGRRIVHSDQRPCR